MERLPESPPNSPSSGPVSIPRIDVAELSVDTVKLGAQLAGTPATLALRGNAHLRSVQDMVIDAAAHRIDGDGDYDLQLRFDRKRMDAALKLHEPAGGPLENILQLPGLGALAATVHLSASSCPSPPGPFEGTRKAASTSMICRRIWILHSIRRPWRRGPTLHGNGRAYMAAGMAASRRRARMHISTSIDCACPEERS
jgi:hypothetical protein